MISDTAQESTSVKTVWTILLKTTKQLVSFTWMRCIYSYFFLRSAFMSLGQSSVSRVMSDILWKSRLVWAVLAVSRGRPPKHPLCLMVTHVMQGVGLRRWTARVTLQTLPRTQGPASSQTLMIFPVQSLALVLFQHPTFLPTQANHGLLPSQVCACVCVL